MRTPIRLKLPSTAVVASTAIVSIGSVLFEPAAAQGVAAVAALVTCSSSSPCASWTNKKAGPAITATGTSGAGAAVSSAHAAGLVVNSTSATTSAIEAYDYESPTSQYGSDGAHILSLHGNGAVLADGLYTNNGISAFTSDGEKWGAVVGGAVAGLQAVTGSGGGGVPLAAGSVNSSGTATGYFYVSGSGDLMYTGRLISYARTRSGTNVTAFETKSTQSSVEDSGTAQLVGGSALVPLNSAFAQAMDLSSPYRVFLTPNGDTRGLYVAQKTAAGFIVRETQGGHGTFSFDYRVLAAAAGHTADRMAPVTSSVQSRLFPMLNPHTVSTLSAAASGR